MKTPIPAPPKPGMSILPREQKTPHYLQTAFRAYIMQENTLQCGVYAGLGFEELQLPGIMVFAQSSEATTCGFGKTGNRVTTVAIVLQTAASMPEEEHWDRWAEIEQMFDYRTPEMARRLTEASPELTFLNFEETQSMSNNVIENTRITQKQVAVLTALKQEGGL